ncbi:MAG: hypothetical protein IT532_10115 [Burkholderiales bacterium]|nr:hypothetical protein [Burkholderiales bacterium]
MPLRARSLLLAVLVASLPACATFRSYDTELRDTLTRAAAGDVGGAIATLERNNRRTRKDLLYYMERGELERLRTRFEPSTDAWMRASEQVAAWESAALADPSRLAGSLASVTLNDKSRPYEGHDYEKVMLTTRIALNHLACGDWDAARVAIRQTHEREAVIARLREQEIEKVRSEAERHGARTRIEELDGYPVETIDNPEVNALRNSYQSAISHYLAGFVYEALGEPGLAAAGYRQAIELRPDTPVLEEALAGLDTRTASADDGSTDVLFLIETGLAPARLSRQFSLPIPVNRELVLISVSFPVLHAPLAPFLPASLHIGEDRSWPLANVTSIDAMARRALQDEMPAIMLRGFVRSAGKAIAQYQAQRAARDRHHHGDDSGGAALDVGALALMLGSMITESADERGWRSLPANLLVARGKLPRGPHRVTLPTPAGERSAQVHVSGRHAFIALRLIGKRLFAMLPTVETHEPRDSNLVRIAPIGGRTD